jgi:(E)-4-hydroxy-3-methylbut-2-enyl-diphosphate synthase
MLGPNLTAAPRRKTRQIRVGSVLVGGDAPISVQSMTITKTADVEGTLQQIYALAGAGADIVRCTCNRQEAAEGLARIVPRSPVPIIADIHNNHLMALAALDAGVHGLRLNPGNIRRPEHIKAVAREAGARGVSIRIGVNAGSLDESLYSKYGGATPEAMVESAQRELAYFEEVGFDDVKISVKASYVPLMIEAYRMLADVTDHPLHVGVTEAGPGVAGLIKGTAGIGALLAEGIGDTIRYSLTADPVEEAKAGRQLLECLGLRTRKNVDLIACPSCGRAEIDVIAVAKEAQSALEQLNLPIQVAVMGCVVNGPGEAREADLGIAAGKRKGHLFIKGTIVRVVPEDQMVASLVEEAERLVAEGLEARLAAADAGAASEAERDRRELLDAQGADVNASEQKVATIRRKFAGGDTRERA